MEKQRDEKGEMDLKRANEMMDFQPLIATYAKRRGSFAILGGPPVDLEDFFDLVAPERNPASDRYYRVLKKLPDEIDGMEVELVISGLVNAAENAAYRTGLLAGLKLGHREDLIDKVDGCI